MIGIFSSIPQVTAETSPFMGMPASDSAKEAALTQAARLDPSPCNIDYESVYPTVLTCITSQKMSI